MAFASWFAVCSSPAFCQELPWDVVQQLEVAYLKNAPEDMACVMRVSFVSGEDRDGFQASHPIPPIRILWKKPNNMKFSFAGEDPRGKSYAEVSLNRFFARLKSVRAVDKLNLSLFDIMFAVLEGDMNAKVIGVEKIGNRETTLVYFPSVFAALAEGASGTGVKLWVDRKEYLPLQARFFTDRAIFTFTAEYGTQKDKAGKTYQLPVEIVLTPDLTEERRSAAFPITMSISDYKINTGLADADFE